nr:hypothetical protein [Candidatus Sigynarchaeota archaeon]
MARNSWKPVAIKAIPLVFMLVMLGYSILSVTVPIFYNRYFQARAQAYAGERVVFTSYFYWYKATGTTGFAPHVVDVWSQANLDKIGNATFPEGWPGPTDPMDWVINRSGTLYHDALSEHPPAQAPSYYANGSVIPGSLVNGTMENITSWFDWMNPAWHEWEIRCMMRAGIDVLMPVYWYNGLPPWNWSIEGLEQLVSTWNAMPAKLVAEGQATSLNDAKNNVLPKICMFFDTTCQKCLYCNNISVTTGTPYDVCWSTLRGADLDDPYWQEMFWQSIAAFFDRVDPVQLFTAPDGSNVVWLYGTEWFSDVGSSVLGYCKAKFQERFNRIVMFVGSKGWVKAGVDVVCPWGACCPGPVLPAERGIPVGEVSPGLYCFGAGSTGFVPRTDEKYLQHWQSVLDAYPVWVHVETWNEFHEGTHIAWSQENGYRWIDLTREMVDEFHAMAGIAPPVSINVPAFAIPLVLLAGLVGVGFAKPCKATRV